MMGHDNRTRSRSGELLVETPQVSLNTQLKLEHIVRWERAELHIESWASPRPPQGPAQFGLCGFWCAARRVLAGTDDVAKMQR